MNDRLRRTLKGVELAPNQRAIMAVRTTGTITTVEYANGEVERYDGDDCIEKYHEFVEMMSRGE